MTANNSGTLGNNMGEKENTKIQVIYPDSTSPVEEELQWAPHHLIPGNQSLKKSGVVPYLGCDKVIEKFGSASKIEDEKTVGYSVNDASNGVWLPSPYALSMKGEWPTDPAKKNAYVMAAIDSTGGNCQFHFNHKPYGDAVRPILDELGAKLQLITESGACKEADANKSNKFKPPMGLKSRLNHISEQLRRITSGTKDGSPTIWQPPFKDDTLVPEYVRLKGLKKIDNLKAKLDVLNIGNVK